MQIKSGGCGWEASELTRLEFEARKEWLGGYISAGRMIAEMREELMEIELDFGAAIGRYGDAGRSGGGAGDGSDRMIQRMERAERLREKIAGELNEIERLRDRIGGCIEDLPMGRLREVLYLRYIRGQDIRAIAQRMNYSERQILNLHNRGVARIRPDGRAIGKIKKAMLIRNPQWAKEEIRIA